MRGWAPENQPEIFIKGSELTATLAALSLANPALIPAYLLLATAFDIDGPLRQRLAAVGCGGVEFCQIIGGGNGLTSS